jgi:hypothetical protein
MNDIYDTLGGTLVSHIIFLLTSFLFYRLFLLQPHLDHHPRTKILPNQRRRPSAISKPNFTILSLYRRHLEGVLVESTSIHELRGAARESGEPHFGDTSARSEDDNTRSIRMIAPLERIEEEDQDQISEQQQDKQDGKMMKRKGRDGGQS